MNYIMRTIYLDQKTIAELLTLSKRTRIPQAVFMREAVDLVLKKHEQQMSGGQKKRKTLKRGMKRKGR